MTQNTTPSQPPRGRPPEAWRVERMVQPVPSHIGEESPLSPWLVVVGVAAVVIIGTLILLFAQLPGSSSSSGAAPSGGGALQSPAASPTRRVTVIRITATPQNTPTATVPPTPVVIKYTVKKGDTLSTIAKQFKVSVESIRAANKLADDTIHIGDVLNIPQASATPGALTELAGSAPPGTVGAPTSAPPVFRTPTQISPPTAAATVKATTPTATPGVVVYTVRSGDTLSTIAGIYSTTVQSIMTLSNISSPSLQVGQTLTVPVGIWSPTAVPPTPVATSTATLTPEFKYAAPDLLSPTDGSDFSHNAAVTLQWLSLGIKSDEYYVVHVRYVMNGMEYELPGYRVNYADGDSLTLDSSPTGNGSPAQFWWYVVVVRENGCRPDSPQPPQPCAVSPVSETRSFTWR